MIGVFCERMRNEKDMDVINENENVFNCKDTILQLFILYQSVYWSIVLILKILPIRIETNLKNHIIVLLSCISLIFICVATFDVIRKSKYKWGGSIIIFFSSTLMLLYKYIQ